MEKQLDSSEHENAFADKLASLSLPTRDDGKPLAIIILGMAGTGKSTFLAAFYAYLTLKLDKKVYIINLDPAVRTIPYKPNLDIRDTVRYKKLMKKYNLGPNGAILTAINLFATKFDGVIRCIEQKGSSIDYILIDTPGQIEVFNWSASGLLISNVLALTVPTCIAFLHETERCESPATLVSSLLYATSITCRSQLPIINLFAKSDLSTGADLIQWVLDPLMLVDAAENADNESYSNSLAKTIALHLSPFYQNMRFVKIAVYVEDQEPLNFDKVVSELKFIRDEYFDEYLPFLLSEKKRIETAEINKSEKELNKFNKDHASTLNLL